MTAETSSQIKDLFDAAFDLVPEARERWLVEACAGDAQLLDEVQKLLLLHAEADEFLEAPPLINDSCDSSPALHADAALGRRIGAYQVIRELGRGGMGAVFLAHRADQAFEKQVAIKLVWPGLGSEEIIQRFQQERQILARLEHKNIARLLDFGIAKLLETNEAALALTHTQLPLTPEYASPEQLNHQPITTATDVYSLGVVLWTVAFSPDGTTLASGSWDKTARLWRVAMPR